MRLNKKDEEVARAAARKMNWIVSPHWTDLVRYSKLLREAFSSESDGTSDVPKEAIERLLSAHMDIAAANGADSRSMPDDYVAIAAWLCSLPLKETTVTYDTIWASFHAAWSLCSGADGYDKDAWKSVQAQMHQSIKPTTIESPAAPKDQTQLTHESLRAWGTALDHERPRGIGERLLAYAEAWKASEAKHDNRG